LSTTANFQKFSHIRHETIVLTKQSKCNIVQHKTITESYQPPKYNSYIIYIMESFCDWTSLQNSVCW